jgi:hypothetical protein
VFAFVIGIFVKLVELAVVIALVAAVVHLARRHSRRDRF